MHALGIICDCVCVDISLGVMSVLDKFQFAV